MTEDAKGLRPDASLEEQLSAKLVSGKPFVLEHRMKETGSVAMEWALTFTLLGPVTVVDDTLDGAVARADRVVDLFDQRNKLDDDYQVAVRAIDDEVKTLTA